MSHLDHLRTFIEAYRQQSFSKAAEKLGITQPAASTHIQSLEAFVGKPLFTRVPRGVVPNEAADELARAVAPMLDGLEEKLAEYRLGGDLGGTIHIAGPADFIDSCMAASLAGFLKQGFQFRLHTGNRERIYQLLNAASVDLAITASPPNDRMHGFARLFTERLLLVLAPALAATLDGEPTAEKLLKIPMIAYDEDLPLIRPVWTRLFQFAPSVKAAMTIPDLRIIKELVLNGHGWSALPDYQCGSAVDSGHLITLMPREQAPANDLYLVWNKAAMRNPRIVHVRDLILSLFNS